MYIPVGVVILVGYSGELLLHPRHLCFNMIPFIHQLPHRVWLNNHSATGLTIYRPQIYTNIVLYYLIIPNHHRSRILSHIPFERRFGLTTDRFRSEAVSAEPSKVSDRNSIPFGVFDMGLRPDHPRSFKIIAKFKSWNNHQPLHPIFLEFFWWLHLAPPESCHCQASWNSCCPSSAGLWYDWPSPLGASPWPLAAGAVSSILR